MATARKCQICLDETPYLHLISRVVRRAWLTGVEINKTHMLVVKKRTRAIL